MNKFASALSAYKRKHKYSYADLAEIMDSDRVSVCRWCKGHREPTAERVGLTAKALKIPVSELI